MQTTEPNIQPRPSPSLFGLILLVLIALISSVGLRRAYGELDALRGGEHEYLQAHIRTDHECWSEIARYARNLNRFFIHHRGFDGEANDSAVTEDDIAEDVAFLTNLLNIELANAVNRFMDSIFYEGTGVSGTYEAQRALIDGIEALGPLYIDRISTYWQARLNERVSNFSIIQNYLESTQEFVFYLHDGVLGETFTNIEAECVDTFLYEGVFAIIHLSDLTFDTFNGIPLSEGFARGDISGLIALPMVQPYGSVVTQAVNRAHISWLNSTEAARRVVNAYIGLTLGSSLITAIVVLKILLPNMSGAWSGVLFGLSVYLKIPFLLKLIFAIYSFAFMAGVISGPFAPQFTQLIPIYLALIVILFSVLLLIRAFRGKYDFLDELEGRIVRKVFSGFGIIRRLSPVLLPMLSIALMTTSVLSLLFAFYCLYAISVGSQLISPMPLVILGTGALGVSLASCVMLLIFTAYAESYYYIKIIAAGNPVSIPEQKGIFGKPLNIINGLSEGLQASLEEQLHAERTKTELITSVSHDLKTPLTSIINYVDLLKKSNIENPSAREYVEILDNKSERLKVLIEDLFEAAKLTSRSMELTLAPVDIIQLLTQAIGELSDKFESNNIEIRYKPPEDKLIIMLDGQRMWRVFENLLNNIANYSPPNSRAYITVEENDAEVEIVMKNISLYPLDIDANELFERFKRGDSARTTEGSGLGLSIAKDIVELHGGRVEIAIDGDLFKVIIGLRKEQGEN